jgi:hypothetical protein
MTTDEVIKLAYFEQLRRWNEEVDFLKDHDEDPEAHAREHIERRKVEELHKLQLLVLNGDIMIKLIPKRR